MSWIRMIKEAFAPFVITMLLFGISDYFLGQHLNDGVAYMCRDELLHHKYCPQSKRTYRMTEFDGGMVFDTYWNKDSVRVENKTEMASNTNFQQYRNILIGDSFIAQRQVLFHERISSILNQRLGRGTAIQFGTGSWNMVTYTQAVKRVKPQKGQNIHIFLMANDFYSNGYGMSNARYYEPFSGADPKDIFWHGHTETARTKLRRWLSNNSFSYQFFNFKTISEKPNGSAQDSNHLPLIELREVQKKCQLLEGYRDSFKNNRTFSLLEHAFDMSCYDQKALDNLNVLKELDIYLTKMGAKHGFSIFYYFVPTGSYQSNEGKEFKVAYGLDGNSVITSEGMRSAIEYTLNKPVFSVERLFKQHTGAPLYYRYDGHWNVAGSSVLADKLAEFINIE